jgi:formylglycine-generating enzyme required for sulfatase activity
MHGNVWEWTTACDEKKRSPYIRDCHRRYRGGSIANKASSLRITHIQSGGVGDRYFALGLRVALSLDQP